jgi:hypothetical protein
MVLRDILTRFLIGRIYGLCRDAALLRLQIH